MTIFKVLFTFLILYSIFYVYSHIEFGSILSSQAQRSNQTIVMIPKGSANPEVDITNLTPKHWYDPTEISVDVNDTIVWTNNDTEPHTVTSGTGGGLNS